MHSMIFRWSWGWRLWWMRQQFRRQTARWERLSEQRHRRWLAEKPYLNVSDCSPTAQYSARWVGLEIVVYYNHYVERNPDLCPDGKDGMVVGDLFAVAELLADDYLQSVFDEYRYGKYKFRYTTGGRQ